MEYRNRLLEYDISTLHCILTKFNDQVMISMNDGTFTVGNDNIKYKYLDKGGQGIVYLLTINNNIKIVVKRELYKPESDNEIKLTKLASEMVTCNTAPNFVVYLTHKVVNNKLLVAMEQITGNLNKFMMEYHNDKTWRSFSFQLLLAVHIMQIHMKTFHNDLKPKNIFYIKLKDHSGYFEYKIGDKQYYLPHMGYIFIIGDFGHAQKLGELGNKLTDEQIHTRIDSNADFYNIQTLYKRIIVSYLIKTYDQRQLLSLVSDNKSFNKYLQKERSNIYTDLKNYPKHIKESMVSKSIAYYIVENNLIDTSIIPESSKTLKVPPDQSVKLIDKLFSQKGDISVIIEKYFYNDLKKIPDSGKLIDSFIS